MSDELHKKIIVTGDVSDANAKLDEVNDNLEEAKIKQEELNKEKENAIKTQATYTSTLEKGSVSLLKTSGLMGMLDANTGGMASKMLSGINAIKGFNAGLGAMRGAIVATGIGALVVLVGTLIAHWDDLSAMLNKTTEEQKLLNEAMEEGKTELIDTFTSIIQVEMAFEDLRDGLISSTDALETYNEKMGDKLGLYEDVNDAEQNFIDNTPRYIESIIKRKQVEILTGKLAQLELDRLESKEKTTLTGWQSFWISMSTTAEYRQDAINAYIEKSAKERVAKFEEEEQKIRDSIKQINREWQELLKGGDIDEKSNKDKAKAIKDREDAEKEAKRRAEENARKAKADADKRRADAKAQADKDAQEEKARLQKIEDDLKKHQDNVTKLNEEFYRDNLTDEEREIYDLEKKYADSLATARAYLESDAENAEKHKEQIAQLEEEKFQRLQEIQAKYTEKERAEKETAELAEIDSYNAAIEDETLKFEDKMMRLDDQLRLINEATEISEDERTELIRKNNEERTRIEKEQADKSREIAEQKYNLAMRVVEDTGQLMNSLSALAGEHTAEGKALAIAGAVIDMLSTNISIVKGFIETIPGPWGIAASIPAVAANVANMMATIKQITAVKIPNTADKGVPVASSPMAMKAPSFNIVGQSSNNQLAETIAGRSNDPIQAYVVSSDVTTAQSLDRNRINNSTFL